MKSIEEIIAQDPVYIGDWRSKFEVVAEFNTIYLSEAEYNSQPSWCRYEDWIDRKNKVDVALQEWKLVNPLFAYYSYANYSGDAWVLFEQDGELWEVSGSHCSCYGLEGQWCPEKVCLLELENRILNGTFGKDFLNEILQFLGLMDAYQSLKKLENL